MGDENHLLIGGVSGGIGRALAAQALEAGWTVSGFGRDAAKLDELKGQLPALGSTTTADASDEASFKAALDELTAAHGVPTAYVHAIGSIFIKPAHLTKLDYFEGILSQNLTSAFLALRLLAPPMQRAGRGNFVFFSTVAARIGLASHEAIAAAKGGVEAMVRSAAASYVTRGLRVNAIAPSLVETPLAAPICSNPAARAVSEKMAPLGRIVQPEEVASLAAWLVSEEAGSVTGQIFTVDGGMSAVMPKPRA